MEKFDVVKEMYAMLFELIGKLMAIFGVSEEDIKNFLTKKDAE